MRIFSRLWALLALALLLAVPRANATTLVPVGDYSYTALQDLVKKNMVEGIPSTVNLFSGRAYSRYEIAILVSKVAAKVANDPDTLRSATPETHDEINKLVQDYRVELAVIGTDVSKVNGGANPILDASKVIEEASKNSYGNTLLGRYSITGYVQARYVDAQSGNLKLFPAGAVSSATASGAASQLAGAVNGNYGEVGSPESFEVRRARLIFLGRPTSNSFYRAQLDLSGAVTSSTTPVKIKEAADYYTPGDGSAKYPTFALGQFVTPFGYALPVSMSASLTPERPVAFSENSNGYGLFNGQDYDKGFKVIYGPGNIKFTYAAINGSGTNAEDIYNHIDSVAHLSYSTSNNVFSIGTSYYAGEVYEASPAKGVEPRKDLYGVDAQFKSRGGTFLDGEYVAGTFEARYYYTGGITTVATQNIDPYVKGNQVKGYYGWGGYTFNQTTSRPLTFGVDYDVFQRSTGTSGGSDQLAVATNKASSSYDDVNYGYGVLYYLDSATRLRLWWDQPVCIAHSPTVAEPTKVGLVSAEVQISF